MARSQAYKGHAGIRWRVRLMAVWMWLDGKAYRAWRWLGNRRGWLDDWW